MGLFGRKKEKAPQVEPQAAVPKQATEAESTVLILGSGCKSCNQLEENTKIALGRLGRSTEVGHVTDFAQIGAYGVMSTPALVADGKVLAYGKVLKPEEIMELLQKI